MTGFFLFWLGGFVATLLNMTIEWSRMGEHPGCLYMLRFYPVRFIVTTVIMTIAWPVLLTAVIAKERENRSSG